MEKTDIISIETWNHIYDNFADIISLYKHSNRKWTQFKNDTHIPETFDNGKWDQNEYLYAFESPFNEKRRNKNLTDSIIESFDYSRFPSITDTYGFRKLKIMKNEGKYGIVSETDSIIVPFIYDFICFNDYENSFSSRIPTYAKLVKENKEGIKIFFTDYNVIEAKYDKILNFNYPDKLNISNNWSFILFKIELNGQSGYVGENGLEYFNIK